MYRIVAQFYPKKLRMSYVNLLRYAGLRINPDRFVGFIGAFGFLLAMASAFFLTLVKVHFGLAFFGIFIVFEVLVYFWLILRSDARAKFVEDILPDVLQLMEQFTAFAFPSVKEGFGMVLLEAMSRALPVVACRVSSMPEIVEHGKTGLLVTPDDPEAMAQGLISVLENNELCSALGTAGRRRVEDYFTVEKMGDGMCEIYHKHIRACRKPA